MERKTMVGGRGWGEGGDGIRDENQVGVSGKMNYKKE